ncbi:MAG: Gfo/Idh/MocA family oxidoreductase [Cardiobacteriaceae bacterium]|nr:Gfo/Idh/MocA family oxidoreductase [Cardiobacteriaceae bacterium]
MNIQTNSTTRKIGVGIIGLSADGGWAAAAHYPSLSKLSDLFTIKGLTASSMAKAEKSSQKYGVPFYSDNAAVLAARDDIDLLVVAVNLPQHQALIEQIAPSGKAIYCEWPLGVNPAQSQAIADVVARHRCRSFIGLQALTSPYVRKIQEILFDSATGKVISCTVAGNDPARGKHIDARYRYAQLQENGVNTLTIPFAHLLAALRYWFGDLAKMSALTACQYPQVTIADSSEIVQRTATDHVFFQAQTAAGALVSAVYRGGAGRLHMEIECEHLTLVITANTGHVQYEPLQIEIRQEDKSEILPAASVAAENLCDTYRAVYADLQKGTQHVPDFSYAVAHQRILFELAEDA